MLDILVTDTSPSFVSLPELSHCQLSVQIHSVPGNNFIINCTCYVDFTYPGLARKERIFL